MVYRLLLDEHVEHEVSHRRENYGHDVEHDDLVTERCYVTYSSPNTLQTNRQRTLRLTGEYSSKSKLY